MRKFRLKEPFEFIAAGTILRRDMEGDYFISMSDEAYIASKTRGGIDFRLPGHVVESNPDVFEDVTDTEGLAESTHPGFRITCSRCGSDAVIVESSVGFSGVSGAWGDVSLKCTSCDYETTKWEPS